MSVQPKAGSKAGPQLQRRLTAFTTVVPQGSPGYMAPNDPNCPAGERYMAVHLVTNGGWGIVDRRIGRLVADPQMTVSANAGFSDVQAAVRALNSAASS